MRGVGLGSGEPGGSEPGCSQVLKGKNRLGNPGVGVRGHCPSCAVRKGALGWYRLLWEEQGKGPGPLFSKGRTETTPEAREEGRAAPCPISALQRGSEAEGGHLCFPLREQGARRKGPHLAGVCGASPGADSLAPSCRLPKESTASPRCAPRAHGSPLHPQLAPSLASLPWAAGSSRDAEFWPARPAAGGTSAGLLAGPWLALLQVLPGALRACFPLPSPSLLSHKLTLHGASGRSNVPCPLTPLL